MNIKPNFFSIVSIGSFNPGILTPEFLKKEFAFNIDNVVDYKHMLNVVSEMNCGDIKFLMELNRFQITQYNLISFDKNQIIKIMGDYLKKLIYTPIKKMGVNFNFNLFVNDNNILIDKLNNGKSFKKFLSINELTHQIEKNITKKNNEEITSAKFFIPINTTKRINIHFKTEKSFFLVNFNYENNINIERKIDLIQSDFIKIHEQMISIIKYFSGD